jgi:hypothetical protein
MILRKVGFLLFLTLAASAALGSSETAFGTHRGSEPSCHIGLTTSTF